MLPWRREVLASLPWRPGAVVLLVAGRRHCCCWRSSPLGARKRQHRPAVIAGGATRERRLIQHCHHGSGGARENASLTAAVRCRCGVVLEERRAKARAGGREAERAGGRAAREGVSILTPKNRGAAGIGGKEPGGPAARRIRLAGVHARDTPTHDTVRSHRQSGQSRAQARKPSDHSAPYISQSYSIIGRESSHEERGHC